MTDVLFRLQALMDRTGRLDFLAPLALRLYLVPVFWTVGNTKLRGMESTIEWFGNPDWGLGLPFPAVLAWLATISEVAGAVLLLIGLAVRWISIPLMVTMVVAAVTVHWKNGWQAVADPTMPFASANIDGAMERLDRARYILKNNGNYDWLTDTGNFVISNNGIEWAATYFLMLLALFFMGGGKLSLDHWVRQRWGQRLPPA